MNPVTVDLPARNGQQQAGSDRLPPFNREAEESLIGSILIDNSALIDLTDLGLTGRDFYIQRLGWIFEAITDLTKGQVRVDMVTLADKLRRNGKLANIGGEPELTRLLTVTPSSLNARYYAGIVKRDSVLRQALDYAGQVAKLAHSGKEAADVISEIEAKTMDLMRSAGSEQGETLAEIGLNFIDLLEERSKNDGIVGLATGLTDLDQLLRGLKPGKVYTLAARPGLGKSSLAAQIALQAAGQQARALFFSLEMDRVEVYTRLVSADSSIPGFAIDNGNLSESQWSDLFRTQNRLAEMDNFRIIDDPAMTLGRLRQEAISQWARSGLDLIIVDYLQLMLLGSKKADNRQAEVATISRGLKVLARQLNIPLILVSQLNRAVESRYSKRPQLSDLRESGAIEQDSDSVIFLYPPDSETPNLVNVYVAKHRGGPTGEKTLFFQKQYFRFALADQQQPPAGSQQASSPLAPPAEPEPAPTWQDRF